MQGRLRFQTTVLRDGLLSGTTIAIAGAGGRPADVDGARSVLDGA